MVFQAERKYAQWAFFPKILCARPLIKRIITPCSNFDKLPGAAERKELAGWAFIYSIIFPIIPSGGGAGGFSADDLKRVGVSGIYRLPGGFKISRSCCKTEMATPAGMLL